jgi:thiol:disulfide interchange protein DsbD
LLRGACAAWLLLAGALAFAASDPLAGGGTPLSRFGAAAGEPQFLPVDEAFVFSALQDGDRLLLRWQMPDGYYLYRERFEFVPEDAAALGLGKAELPDGKRKQDEYFGEVEVYYHGVDASVPLLPRRPAGSSRVGVTYQGCADAGLCYPPETRWVDVDTTRLAAAAAGSAAPDAAAASAGSAMAAPDTAAASAGAPGTAQAATEEGRLAQSLAAGWLWSLGLFFAAGIGLAFTPCVLPMVPILSSIVVGSASSRASALSLSLSYVLGMAATYALFGMLIGLFGASLNLQAAFQSPPVLVGFAAVFVALSLSMFGFYELQLPAALQTRLSAMADGRSGTLAGVAIMGAASALVVSPCVSAPLAGALIYLSTTGDALRGGSALLALGLGMGAPLLLVGAGGGRLLPRAGAWMNHVKAVFGVLLLGVALWLVERLLPAPVALAAWGVLLVGCGVQLGALDFAGVRSGMGRVAQTAGIVALAWGLMLNVGAASGATDPLAPLARLGGAVAAAPVAPAFRDVAGIAGVQLALAEAPGRPAMLDFYADWCISCKVMERRVFPDPRVAPLLAGMTLLRADVTANSPVDQALLDAYGLAGPPAFVFFDAGGRELAALRTQGEKDVDALVAHLEQVQAAARPQVAAVARLPAVHAPSP